MEKLYVCAGKSESFDFATPIGIGLMQSAINLTKICLKQNPKEIVFVGTAGSYGSCKTGEIFTCKKSSNIEIGFFDKLSYTPLKNHIVSRETPQDVIVNSSNFITCNSIESKKMLTNGLDLENMEFFAVQSVAKNFGKKSYGIFYVTNYCNENAHKDFMKNHKIALEKLNLHVKKMTI